MLKRKLEERIVELEHKVAYLKRLVPLQEEDVRSEIYLQDKDGNEFIILNLEDCSIEYAIMSYSDYSLILLSNDCNTGDSAVIAYTIQTRHLEVM